MRVCETTVNFRLSCVVTMATCLLCSHLPFTSGQQDSNVPNKESKLSKRDVGLEHCKYHPRNCPGGFMRKRGRYILENLRQLLPSSFKPEGITSLADDVPRDVPASSSSSSSLSSSIYSSPFSPEAADDLELYSTEEKFNRDLFDLLMSSTYGQSRRRRSW